MPARRCSRSSLAARRCRSTTAPRCAAASRRADAPAASRAVAPPPTRAAARRRPRRARQMRAPGRAARRAEERCPAWRWRSCRTARWCRCAATARTGGPRPMPVGTDTVFRLASLSKALRRARSARMLVAEGAMRWDSPIINQLPAFKLRDYASASSVTVARRAQPPRRPDPQHLRPRPRSATQPYPLLAEKLADAPMACTPGDCYGYQNIAFSLIGDLVFAATGDFYSHQVEKRHLPSARHVRRHLRPRRARGQPELGAAARARPRRLGAGAAEGNLLPRAAGRRRQRQHPRHGAVAARADRPSSRRAARRRCSTRSTRRRCPRRANCAARRGGASASTQRVLRARLAGVRLRRPHRWSSTAAPCRAIAA